MKLKADLDLLTLDDLIAFEDASQMKAREMRDLLARFATDDTGAILVPDAARVAIGKLTLGELRDTIAQFGDALKELQARAIPPTTGADS